ncbi:unnamed protein product [Kuraishia capsulata CBS 1993]|uniref:BHLH domain-containing protein n=1 Tax=Kuraishia capsulata CBS 1993 TaxID=1382522 RepID=W6MQ17_9ASCO|nr:uncharacterized protein KUCA_T00004804001 [Kuraishia capsulata CBS 1993]CDK28819.1 unnamed protein product [Kuraishia capsulata CBS 1993]
MSMTSPQPVSLSPFEYSTPAGAHTGDDYFSTDMDFDTAYQLMTGDGKAGFDGAIGSPVSLRTAEEAANSGLRTPTDKPHVVHPQPSTPANTFGEATEGADDPYRSFEYHRNQILKGSGVSMPFASPRLNQLSTQSAIVSPNTRNILHSINSLNSQNTQFQLSDSGYELLSITETSALEQFLDSIVDDTKLSLLSKHWSSIDPLANGRKHALPPHLQQQLHGHQNFYPQPELDLPLKLQSQNMNRNAVSLPKHHMISLTPSNPATAVNSVLPSGANSPRKDLPSYSDDQLRNHLSHVFAPDRKPETSQTFQRRLPDESAREDSEEPRRDKLKKSLLTSDEKRRHHTSSEQKRRSVIREAYDVLVDMVSGADAIVTMDEVKNPKKRKTNEAKRAMSKSLVMNKAVNEIRALISLNSQLRYLIENTK